MTPHRVLTAILALLLVMSPIALVLAVLQQSLPDVAVDTVGLIALAALLFAHLRGWRWSAQTTIVLVSLVVIGSVPADSQQQITILYDALIPTILALVLLPWYWSAGAFVFCTVGILAQIGLEPLASDPGVAIVLFILAAGCSLASAVLRTAQQRAEISAQHAEEALQRVERQATELTEANELMTEQLDQQRRLLDLVTTLETPVVALADGVLLAPVVGSLDSRRAQSLTSRLLEAVSQQRARLVVLDIAGLTSVDTSVARALLDATQAVRLLGSDVILSGISAAVATTLTHLNINLEEIKTARSPQDALQQYGVWTGAPVNGARHTTYRYGAN